MRTYLCYFAIGLMGGAAVGAAQSDDSIPELLRAVDASPGDGALLQKLISALNERLHENPADKVLQYNLGLAYFRAGEYARALPALQKVEPPDPETDNLKGDVYEHLHRPLDAIHAYQRAAEQAPANEDFRFDYILELLDHETYSAAALIAGRATTDFPHSLRILLAYAVALFANGDFAPSAARARQAQSLNTDSELAIYLLVLSDEGQHIVSPDAEDRVQMFSRRHPDHYLGYYLRGRLGFNIRHYEDAVRQLSMATQLSPKHADSWLVLGKSYEALGNHPQSLRCYRRAVEADPERADAWYRLATLARTLGHREEARSALAKFRVAHDRNTGNGGVVRFLYQLK